MRSHPSVHMPRIRRVRFVLYGISLPSGICGQKISMSVVLYEITSVGYLYTEKTCEICTV